MTLTLDERLNQIIPRITSPDFLGSKGLGNEIGFWIFDYPPDRERGCTEFCVNGQMAGNRRTSRSGYDRKYKESSAQRPHRQFAG